MIDLKYENNDVVIFGSDIFVSDLNLLKQRLEIKFKWLKGEYKYDKTYGFDVFAVFSKKPLLEVIEIFEKAIKEEKDVIQALLLDLDFDREKRKLSLKFEVESRFGVFVVDV